MEQRLTAVSSTLLLSAVCESPNAKKVSAETDTQTPAGKYVHPPPYPPCPAFWGQVREMCPGWLHYSRRKRRSQLPAPEYTTRGGQSATNLVADLSSTGGSSESSSAVSAGLGVLGALAGEVALVAALVASLGLAVRGAVAYEWGLRRGTTCDGRGGGRGGTNGKGDPPGCTGERGARAVGFRNVSEGWGWGEGRTL